MSSLATRGEGEIVLDGATSTVQTKTTTAEGARTRPRQGRRLSNRALYRIIGLASVIGGLVLWQVLADTNVLNVATSSSPSNIWDSARLLISNGTLGSSVAASAKLYGVGLGASILIGITLGLILGRFRLLSAVFDPWIAMLYSTPLVALLPLILVWFGITFLAQVVVVVVVSVFALLVNVMVGVREVDPGLKRLAQSFRGSELAVLRTLVLPAIVPYVVTGVRLAVGFAFIGVVVSEYFMGDQGIGGMIVREGNELNTGAVFVGIVVIAGAALVMTGIVRALESRVSGWRDEH